MDKDDLIFRSYTPASFSVLKVDCNEIRAAWAGGVDRKDLIRWVSVSDRGDQCSFVCNFDYISYYSMFFCFHQVKQKSISLSTGKVQ